jgi:predicted nucleic acid-binding protein
MIVVDSSVWIANLRGLNTPPVQRLLQAAGQEPLLVGDLVLAEVLQGARDEAHAVRIERNLRQFVVQSIVSDAIAVQAARNYRTMRARASRFGRRSMS